MDMLGYTSCLADPDLWISKEVNDNGCEYYEYMLLYVDNYICISGQPREALEEVNNYCSMKDSSIGPPKIYLGAKVGKVKLTNGVEAYDISMIQYVQKAGNNVEKYLHDRGLALLKKALKLLLKNYSPEVDEIPDLNEREAAFYKLFIWILRWMAEMGGLDICIEVSAISSFVAMSREVNFQQLLHMFAYLKIHHNDRIVFDP